MWHSSSFIGPISWEDAVAGVLTLLVCLIWLGVVNALVRQNVLEPKLSRKVIHIFTGPIFLLCWSLYSDRPTARLVAAVVPLLITTKFLLTGLGILHDPETVASISRTGDRRELLYGPLMYGLVFIVCDVAFWRHSPAGITGLMVLCGGDGLAEVVGTRYGRSSSRKLPWSSTKSWPGSAAMFVGSFAFSALFLHLFNSSGNFHPPLLLIPTLLVLVGVAFMSALIESLCWEHWDNVVVPLAAIGLCSLGVPVMQGSAKFAPFALKLWSSNLGPISAFFRAMVV